MTGTVKFFDNSKGWGFVEDSEGRGEFFIHYSSICMDGRKELSNGDIVDFEVGIGKNDREQALNVQPVLTKKMIEDALKEENLHLQTVKDVFGVKKYLVLNADNVLQTGEQGMSLVEMAGFDVEGLTKEDK